MFNALSTHLWRIATAFLMIVVLPMASALAQPNQQPPSDAMVIAQGIDVLPAGNVTWHVNEAAVPIPDSAEFVSMPRGFTIGADTPLIVTDGWSGRSTLLHENQAAWHPDGALIRLSTANGQAGTALEIALVSASGQPLAGSPVFTGTPFDSPTGTYAIQLTADTMLPGDSSAFTPPNALPWLLFVANGEITVESPGQQPISINAGTTVQMQGAVTIESATGAVWHAATIGNEVVVPPIPLATGSLLVKQMSCPDGTDPLTDDSSCEPMMPPLDLTVANGPESFTILKNGVDLGKSNYRLTDLTVGTWSLTPSKEGTNIPVKFALGGDAQKLNEGWTVGISAGTESLVTMYVMSDSSAVGSGTLTLHMFECPAGTDVQVSTVACDYAIDAPNVQVSRVTATESLLYNSQSDAETPQPGLFHFREIPSGSYLLEVDDGGTWRSNELTFWGDTVFDGGSWTVSVPEDSSTIDVYVFHVPAANSSVRFQFLICDPGTVDPDETSGCVVSDATGATISIQQQGSGTIYVDSVDGMYDSDGSVEFAVPAGTYDILAWWPPGTQAYTDMNVTLAPDSFAMVYVYVVPDEHATGNVFAYPYLCAPGVADPEASGSCNPTTEIGFGYRLINVDTGDIYSSTDIGVPMGDGSYMLTVPAGTYMVDVHNVAIDYGVEHEYEITVPANGWVDIIIYLIPKQ